MEYDELYFSLGQLKLLSATYLAILFNAMLFLGHVPPSLLENKTILIPKKPNPTSTADWRPITGPSGGPFPDDDQPPSSPREYVSNPSLPVIGVSIENDDGFDQPLGSQVILRNDVFLGSYLPTYCPASIAEFKTRTSSIPLPAADV
jgi:hypothetical protein